ncbi:hypothetical protein GCM10009660_45060 [Catellatospora bangladeshensis]
MQHPPEHLVQTGQLGGGHPEAAGVEHRLEPPHDTAAALVGLPRQAPAAGWDGTDAAHPVADVAPQGGRGQRVGQDAALPDDGYGFDGALPGVLGGSRGDPGGPAGREATLPQPADPRTSPFGESRAPDG